MSKPISVRVSDQALKRLDRLARTTNRTKAALASQAIDEFLDLQEWQVAAIMKGIEAADRGETVSHQDALRELEKWEKGGRAD